MFGAGHANCHNTRLQANGPRACARRAAPLRARTHTHTQKKANGTHKWRTVSLQGCPREVRGLLAGEYYHDVDMVNSLPNVAKQLHKLGMTSEANVRVLSQLCAERKEERPH